MYSHCILVIDVSNCDLAVLLKCKIGNNLFGLHMALKESLSCWCLIYVDFNFLRLFSPQAAQALVVRSYFFFLIFNYAIVP